MLRDSPRRRYIYYRAHLLRVHDRAISRCPATLADEIPRGRIALRHSIRTTVIIIGASLAIFKSSATSLSRIKFRARAPYIVRAELYIYVPARLCASSFN